MRANIITVVSFNIRLNKKAEYSVAYRQPSRIEGSWYCGYMLGVF